METDLKSLCFYGNYRKFQADTFLHKEGDDVNGKCYLILSGKVEEKKSFDIDNAFTRDIEKGNVAGVVELFSQDEKRLTGLKTVVPSEVYEWDIHGLKEIASSNLAFCFFIIRKLSTVLRGLDFEYKELAIKLDKGNK